MIDANLGAISDFLEGVCVYGFAFDEIGDVVKGPPIRRLVFEVGLEHEYLFEAMKVLNRQELYNAFEVVVRVAAREGIYVND